MLGAYVTGVSFFKKSTFFYLKKWINDKIFLCICINEAFHIFKRVLGILKER